MNAPTSVIDKLLNVALIAGGGVALYFFVSAKMKKAALQDTEGKLGQSKEGQQALQIRAALNPSGMSWLMGADGTNNKALFITARNITDFKAVASAYRNLFQSDLSTDLTNELKAQEATMFFNIVNATKEKRYLPNDVVQTKTGKITLYKLPNPTAKNIVNKIDAINVLIGKEVNRVQIFDKTKNTQVLILMNNITFQGKNYWVLSNELKPKK